MINKQLQPSKHKFQFSAQELKQIDKIIAKYPEGKQASAVMPVLDLAQRKNNNWLPKEAIEAVADLLHMPVIKVWEVASFYSMYNLHPVGKYHIQVCRTTPCWLKQSDKIVNTCKEHTDTNINETSQDGMFTISEVECLGACVNAPVMQINDDYYENLDENKVKNIINDLKKHNNKG